MIFEHCTSCVTNQTCKSERRCHRDKMRRVEKLRELERAILAQSKTAMERRLFALQKRKWLTPGEQAEIDMLIRRKWDLEAVKEST